MLAELVSGRSHNHAVYGRQRWCGVELADGGAEFQAGWMLLSALSWLRCGVYSPLWGSMAVQLNDVTSF